MANLIDIRRRIKSTKNTQQITKAMKMVSASRLRRASERAMDARPYATRIAEVHDAIVSRLPEYSHPLYTERKGKTLLIALGGDKGLCGSFNANIFKQAKRRFEDEGMENFTVIPVGKKSISHFKKTGVECLEGYPDVFRALNFELAESLSKRVIELFTSGEFARVVILFNKFKNVLVQDVTETQLLPLSADAEQESEGVEHKAEPSLEVILEGLGPQVVMTQVFQALLESCASEHAARMTAMDAATNNAKEMIEKLTLEMNKARQAAITKELIEVVSGAAAL